MKQLNLNKSRIATAITLILGASTLTPVYAEETNKEVEVIEVTGIRSSLVKSVDIKRNANGVVDAITAEDIGKFPDGNLAESLQRITGVSIDRSNGEGARITVRGMGPEFNMVTLNGRQMPTIGGRAFDFNNIATDAVSAVEVYKTAKANLPTGGIGATVNMMTARPLSDPGFKAVISGKAVHETSVEDVGSKFTPEISGLFTNTFADNKLGVLVSASYQDRDNREESAAVDSWYPIEATTTNVTNNNQRADGTTWYPQNAGYAINDNSRQRTNAQLVVEYEPNDKVKAKVDYTYSKVEFKGDYNSFGVWFNHGNILGGDINENGTWTRVVEQDTTDYANNVGRNQFENENKSLGLNIQWQASDNLLFTFDAHDSSAVGQGKGLGNNAFIITGNTGCLWCEGEGVGPNTAAMTEKTAYYPAGGVPYFEFDLVDGAGNPTTEILPGDLGSLFAGVSQGYSENEMTQFQFQGEWLNDGDGALSSIDFGFSRTEQKYRSTNAFTDGFLALGWWLGSARYWPDDAWQLESTSGLLSDFSNSGDIGPGYFWTQPFDDLVTHVNQIDASDTWLSCCFRDAWPEELNGTMGAGSIDSDARVKEVVNSIYAQFTFSDEFNGMPFNLVAGLRYEETKVTSVGLETPVTDIKWIGGNEFQYVTGEQTYSEPGKATLKQFLPSLDADLEITDDIIARASYSRSLTRPGIGDMRSTRDFAGGKIGTRQIISGNPGLEPYLADNFDFSVEYYYGEGSYASVGYFKKVVDNFLVDSFETVTVEGIRDVFSGPRADQARADLEAEGLPLSFTNIYERIKLNEGIEGTDIFPNSDDPLAEFEKVSRANGESANLHGWELAAQHLFADTGFGVMVNATFVSGDIEADRDLLEQEFALPGMSDSANFSVFYENEQLSARISYNWRDEFLSGFDQYGSPVYTEEYSQVDANVSYSVTENFTVFAEALNLTEETQRTYVRYSEQLLRANQYGARFNIGARYVF
ncbi:TonB-dependent receptor [Thalassotalea insulae]|uniref:TonB-dependent receptor n=1 Tax=Thalassotalea insulae TaxID=2056778 RepID=A0ABQ6GPL9_9GAMM|nr:TonB-dependent receptor [Thalassotalea insulae]GLX77831.1 TonB-dependent receptor [Thalassotalea insulae]